MKNTENNAPRLFLDTNIIIDYLLFRGDEAMAIEHIFESSMDESVILYIAAHSLTNIYYILRKEYSSGERKQLILNLCALCRVAEINSECIEDSISNNYAVDLEDSLQIRCAVETKCDYFLTRDFELFEKSPVKTILPHEIVKKINL